MSNKIDQQPTEDEASLSGTQPKLVGNSRFGWVPDKTGLDRRRGQFLRSSGETLKLLGNSDTWLELEMSGQFQSGVCDFTPIQSPPPWRRGWCQKQCCNISLISNFKVFWSVLLGCSLSWNKNMLLALFDTRCTILERVGIPVASPVHKSVTAPLLLKQWWTI